MDLIQEGGNLLDLIDRTGEPPVALAVRQALLAQPARVLPVVEEAPLRQEIDVQVLSTPQRLHQHALPGLPRAEQKSALGPGRLERTREQHSKNGRKNWSDGQGIRCLADRR